MSKKKSIFSPMKYSIFASKNLYILHGQVFIMDYANIFIINLCQDVSLQFSAKTGQLSGGSFEEKLNQLFKIEGPSMETIKFKTPA